MLLSLCRCKLRHINHIFINIVTSILGGRWWHGILRIRWSPTRYWRSLLLWHCVLWRAGLLLTNWGHLGWVNYWIVPCGRHRYHQLWQLISICVAVLAIKAPGITGSVLWRSGWLLKNWGQLRWIDDWIIQWRRHMYHWWWKFINIWVNALVIKGLVITSTCLLPIPIVPCSNFVATTNTLWTWNDECNMGLWWCCVPVILFVYGQQKVRANFLAQRMQ